MQISPTSIKVANLCDLRQSRKITCRVADIDILLIYRASGIVAIENKCSHLGLPLDQGRVIGGQIYCPHHGACFDLVTGQARSGPAVSSIRKFDVEIIENDIFICLENLPAKS